MKKDVDLMLGEPRKAIRSMAVPVMIALLISQINTFVDSVWCSSLGVDALSAINLVSSVYFIVIGIGNGIGVGLNVAISRRIGEGDREGAERCVYQTIFVMSLVSLPLIPVLLLAMEPLIIALGGSDILSESEEYLLPIILLSPFAILNGVICGALRGEGAVRLSTILNVVAAVVNIVLDPVLIFVLGLGLSGASLATMVSSVAAVALGFYAYRSGTTYLRPLRSRPERTVVGDVMYVGIPQAVELNVMSLMNFFLIYFVVRCGGTDGFAVYSVPWRLVSLAMVPAEAMAAAMVPVCSSAIGQRDAGRLRDGYRFTVLCSFVLGLLMSLVILVLADPAMYAFTYSDDMAGYRAGMVHALRIYTVFLPFYGLIYVGSSMLSVLRKSGYSLMSSFLRNVALILIYWLASYHTMDWIYWGLAIGEIAGGLFMLALAQWQFSAKYRSMCSASAVP